MIINNFIRNKGFTLVETLVVLGIIAVLAGILTVGFKNFTTKQIVDKEAGAVVSILSSTRSKALASEESSVYGVNFDSNKVTIFKDGSYDPGNVNNIVIALNSGVVISNVSLAGGGSFVVSDKLLGATEQNGTVTLTSVASSTLNRVITIYKTGLAE